jgi:hypothetical protein
MFDYRYHLKLFVLYMLAWAVAYALSGCATRTSTTTIMSADGEETYKINAGPYSHDESRVVDTTAAFRECRRRNYETKGRFVDEYCRSVTKPRRSEVGVGTPGAFGYGGYGPGMIVQGRPPYMGMRPYAYPGTHVMTGFGAGQTPPAVVQAGQPTQPSALVTRDEHRRDLAPLYKQASGQENRLQRLEGRADQAPDSETKPATPDAK